LSVVVVVADSTAGWSPNTVLQYITSLTQNAAVKPGTIFISRPLVSASEDDGKGTELFTNGTELTVSNDPVSVVVAADEEQLQEVVIYFSPFFVDLSDMNRHFYSQKFACV